MIGKTWYGEIYHYIPWFFNVREHLKVAIFISHQILMCKHYFVIIFVKNWIKLLFKCGSDRHLSPICLPAQFLESQRKKVSHYVKWEALQLGRIDLTSPRVRFVETKSQEVTALTEHWLFYTNTAVRLVDAWITNSLQWKMHTNKRLNFLLCFHTK